MLLFGLEEYRGPRFYNPHVIIVGDLDNMKVSFKQMTCVIVLLILIISIALPLATIPASKPRQVEIIDKFGDGDTEKTLVFLPGGGKNQEAFFNIPQNQTVLNATFEVEALPNGKDEYPANITINAGQDNDYEWGFIGDGYGPLGKQKLFKSNETNTTLFYGSFKKYDNSNLIRLPKHADIEYADLKIGGLDPVADPAEKSLNLGSYSIADPFNNQRSSVRFQTLYYQHEIDMGGIIDKIYFQATKSFKNIDFDNFRIRISETPLNSLGVNFSRNYGVNNLTVMDSSFIELGAATPGVWLEFDVNNTFFYNNTQNLLIEILWEDKTGNTGTAPIEAGVGLDTRRVFAPNHNAFTGAADSLMYNFKVSFETDWAHDITVDVGDNNKLEYAMVGKFNKNVFITGVTYELQNYVGSYFTPVTYIDQWGNEFVDVPVNVTCSNAGRVYLSNMSIKYSYVPVVNKNGHNGNLSAELTEHIPQTGDSSTNVKINLDIEAGSAGKLWLKNIWIVYKKTDNPPVALPIPALHAKEDKVERIDLSPYFLDDNTKSTDMTYEILNFTDNNVNVMMVNNCELEVDSTKTPNWHGNFSMRVRVFDDIGNPTESDFFTVFVDPVNDEPTPYMQIPDIILDEDTTSENIFFNASEYFTDIDFDSLFYSIEIDPNDVVPGEDIKITINNGGTSFTITGRNNWYGQNIPIWIYCDDDSYVNTRLNITEGYVYQEVLVTVNPVNDAPYWLEPEGVPNININEDESSDNFLFLEDYVGDIDTDVSDLEYSVISQEDKEDKVEAMIDINHYLDINILEQHFSGSTTVTIAVIDEKSYIFDQFLLTVSPVDDPPVVKISSHYNRAILEGIVNIVGTVSDVEGHKIEGAEVKLQNETFSSSWEYAIGTDIWSYEWDTTQYGDGWYDFTVKAYQYTGGTTDNVLYSNVLTYKFYSNNDKTRPPPTNEDILINLTQPNNGDTIKGEVTISGNSYFLSEGNVTEELIDRVQIRIIGPEGKTPWYDATGTNNWTFTWDTLENHFDNGDYTIQVMAIKEGNCTIVQINVKVDNPSDPDPGGDDIIKNILPGDDSAQRLYFLILLILVIIIVLVVILVAVLKKRHRDEEDEDEDEDDERVELAKPEDKKTKGPEPKSKPPAAPKPTVSTAAPKPTPAATPAPQGPIAIAKPLSAGGASSLASEFPLVQKYSPAPMQMEILPVAKTEVKPKFKVHFCTSCKKPFKIKLPINPKEKIMCPWCDTRNILSKVPAPVKSVAAPPLPPKLQAVVAKPVSSKPPQPSVAKPGEGK